MKVKEIIKEAEERYPEKDYPSTFIYRRSAFIEGAKLMMEDINYKELYYKLKIELFKLKGEYQGFCEGLLHWDLPKELKAKIEAKIEEFEDNND